MMLLNCQQLLQSRLTQPVPSKKGVCGGPLAFDLVSLVSNIANWQLLACAKSPGQPGPTKGTGTAPSAEV
jgi:hypothetical protein